MRRLHLFWKVYLHGLGLLVLVATAVFLSHSLNWDDSGWRDLHLRLASHLAEHTSALLEDRSALTAELQHMREILGVDLTYYDLDGTMLATNIDPPLPPLTSGQLRELGAGAHCTEHTYWHVIAPLQRNGEMRGYLVLEDSVHPVGESAEHATMLCFALLALVLGSIPLAAMIARPLEKLTKAVNALGAGDLSVRSGINRNDEVGQLARAFDEMASRLERLILGEKELLANVSHELRTPLARIRVALDIASEGDLDRARTTIADIATDLDELERIVEDLLTAARLDFAAKNPAESKAPLLRREEVELGQLVDRVATRFRSVHPDRALSIEVEGTAKIDADLNLLRRAVDNLLDNAKKYSDADRPITLRARAEESCVSIDVGDQGIGIDEADLQSVFTPFFRTDRSRARSAGGVGLGLTLARRIVEAHGGRIAIESKPGYGTTVHVSVPRA